MGGKGCFLYVCVCVGRFGAERLLVTSAVLGTLSQNTSILMSPRVVCNVTDMVNLATASHRFDSINTASWAADRISFLCRLCRLS